jgi:hypothetical protein
MNVNDNPGFETRDDLEKQEVDIPAYPRDVPRVDEENVSLF